MVKAPRLLRAVLPASVNPLWAVAIISSCCQVDGAKRDKPTSRGIGPWPPHWRQRSIKIRLVRHACGCTSAAARSIGFHLSAATAIDVLSTPCRSPVTSRASVRRSMSRQYGCNARARLRSSWPWPAATPDARVASAACRPWLIASFRAPARRSGAYWRSPPEGRRPAPDLREPAVHFQVESRWRVTTVNCRIDVDRLGQ
jgi:hypothetical protein